MNTKVASAERPLDVLGEIPGRKSDRGGGWYHLLNLRLAHHEVVSGVDTGDQTERADESSCAIPKLVSDDA